MLIDQKNLNVSKLRISSRPAVSNDGKLSNTLDVSNSARQILRAKCRRNAGSKAGRERSDLIQSMSLVSKGNTYFF